MRDRSRLQLLFAFLCELRAYFAQTLGEGQLMLSKPEAREAILSMIIAHYPQDVWAGLERGTAWAYREAWSSTRDDPRFAKTPGQRRFRAPQERHFLMEGALAVAAEQNHLVFAGEVVKTNDWVYGMIRAPGVCIMQKKVRDGREPPPADFRRQVASANTFVRQGDLFVLGDGHIAGEQPIHGILIHTTESQHFTDEGYGRPAFVRLAFPFGDYSGWAAEFTLPELAAAYPSQDESKTPARPKPTPKWRKPDQEEKNG